MEIVIKSRIPLGYSLAALEEDVRTMLGDDGRITGGGYGIDGWILYVEMKGDLTEKQFKPLAASIARMKVPVGTVVQATAPDGTEMKVKIRAEQRAGEVRLTRGG